MFRPNTSVVLVLVALTGMLLASGCVATVRGPAVVTTGGYDTNQCYWTWVDDGYGGYEQLFCYSGPQRTYVAVVHGGGHVRRYPTWYRGQRVVTVAPRVRIVRPRGVVIRPRPIRAPSVTVRGSVRVR